MGGFRALNLIPHLLHENNADYDVASELGFSRIIIHLAGSGDPDVREAALHGLLELARDKADGTCGRLTKDDEKLKQLLEERIDNIGLMSPDDLGTAKEERQLVDSIWNPRYKETSSLREKGPLILPGENAPPPDVASSHFEPSLRAFSTRDASKGSAELKDKPPLLLGSGPPSP